jgi:hypothetical protein
VGSLVSRRLERVGRPQWPASRPACRMVWANEVPCRGPRLVPRDARAGRYHRRS